MPTVYCDHNVLVRTLDHEGIPPQGPFGDLVTDERAKFVFSPTHLVEAARAPTIERAAQLGEFVDWAARGWLRDRVGLELDEIKHALGVGPAPVILCRTLTEVLARLHEDDPREAEVVTAARMARAWRSRPELLRPMENSVRQNREAFRENVRRFRVRKLTPERDTELSRAIVRRLCQIHRIAVTAEQANATEIERMPTFHTEAVLSRMRWGRGGNLRWQGFMDNEHLIVALPHVDVYVTFDIRQRRFARRLGEQCSSSHARVVGSLNEILEEG